MASETSQQQEEQQQFGAEGCSPPASMSSRPELLTRSRAGGAPTAAGAKKKELESSKKRNNDEGEGDIQGGDRRGNKRAKKSGGRDGGAVIEGKEEGEGEGEGEGPVIKRFENVQSRLADAMNAIRDASKEVVLVNKEYAKLRKAMKRKGDALEAQSAKTASKKKGKAPAVTKKEMKRLRKEAIARGEKPASRNGFNQPCPVSDEMCDFLGVAKGTRVARTDVVRSISAYIKHNGLKHPEKKNVVVPDAKLASIIRLPADKESNVTYFSLQKYIKHNFLKKQDDGAYAAADGSEDKAVAS